MEIEPLHGGLESSVALAWISEQRGQRLVAQQLVFKQLRLALNAMQMCTTFCCDTCLL